MNINLNYSPNDNCYNLCWLESEWGQCCCECIYQKELFNHPWFTQKPCNEQTGIFICVNPEFEGVTPTGKHSVGCECFQQKAKEIEI